jgi:hypothetical protein
MLKSDVKMNGLLFLPRLSKKWYIYVNETEIEDYKKGGPVMNTTNSEQEFIMIKTDIPDVYELYWDIPGKERVREGIAGIPSIKLSHYCRSLFANTPSVKLKGAKSVKFNKWIPLYGDIMEYSQVL